MKFVLFRHAHKGILPFEDPELSLQGFEQAVRIADLIKQGRLPKPTHLYASPRKRASQTFFPISKALDLKIEILSDLDQQNPAEVVSDFRKRVQHFIQQIQPGSSPDFVIYACTHYDWIEEAMTLINCDKELNSFEFSHWSPTQHILFELQSPLWKFIKKGSVV